MKILLVLWALLLFGVSLNSGHYIRQAKDGEPSTYEVHDDSSGITFTNPKQDKRTLREILYYHIIERPRTEPVATERSFTNSHGYQFFDLAPLLESYDDNHEDEDDGSYVEQTNVEDQAEDSQNHEEDLRTTQEPLTDQDLKEAYKARSYLFDQMRQRYSVKRMAIPEPSLNRRKRQAEVESTPDAPSFSTDIDSKAAYMKPKTYGMNLNGDSGYVWNNLNNPPTYYELGASKGNPNEGSPGSQSQENTPPSSENAYIAPAVPNESESSEDIYINTNRPSAQPLDTVPEISNPEPSNESPEPINDNPGLINESPGPINDNPEPSDSGANYPVEPIIGGDNSNLKPENEGFATNGPYENPEPIPVQPETAEPSVPQQPDANEYPISEGPVGESNENSGYGYGQPGKTKIESSTEESSEGDQIKEIPVAPTLPPLNYDGLPDYIRDAISSSEKPASYEQTDNPYTNPQPNPEDKQVMQDQMEGIFATMQPVEDIPKTYGMNLTSDGGHVWNDMVNPPISYDVGSPSQSEEEHKEEQPAPVSEQPEPEPAEPEREEPVANPEEPSQKPETHESEEAKPAEEPAEPEKEPEEPITNPSEENHEPPAPENDNKPIEEPAEPTETVEPEPAAASENPDVPELGNEQPENPEPVPAPGNEESKHTEPVPEPGKEPEHPEPVPEPANEEPENPEPGNEEPEHPELVPEPGNEDTEQTSEEPAEESNEENDKADIMSKLLKSEQFWKWLGEWTGTYMELLEKHIRKIAIQEICNRKKSGEQMCFLEDQPEDNDDDGVIIKDGKIIVDGKEIDITNTDNLDKDLKRGHQNKGDNEMKNKNENKIEASTIYGNSVGNEKVTNVFIFTADKADEVIENLKPANKSEIDFVIDDRIKENENKEKSTEVETDQSESNLGNSEPNTSEVNKEETYEGEVNNKETNEGEANKEESNNEETNKGEVNKEEPNEEGENEEELIKESESEGDNEEFNNESNSGEASIGDNKDAKEPNKEESSSDIKESERDDSKLETSERKSN